MTDFKNKDSEEAVMKIADHIVTTHAALTHKAKCDVIRFFNGYVVSNSCLNEDEKRVVIERLKERANAVCADMAAESDGTSHNDWNAFQPIGCEAGKAHIPCGRSKCVLYNGAILNVSSSDLAGISRHHVYSSPLLMSDTRGGRVMFVDCDDNRKVWVVNPDKFNKRFGVKCGQRIPQRHITYQQLRAQGMSHIQALEWMSDKPTEKLPPPVVPRCSDYVYNAVDGQSVELKRDAVVGIGKDVVGKNLEELVSVDPELAAAFDFYSMGLFPAHRIYALFPGAMVFFPRKIKGKASMVYAVSVNDYSAAAARDPSVYPPVSGVMERTFNIFRALGYNDIFSREYARAFPFVTPDDFTAMRAALDADPTLSIGDVVIAAAKRGNGVEMGIAGKRANAGVYSNIGLEHIGAAPPTPVPRDLTFAAEPKKDSDAMVALRKAVSDANGNCSLKTNNALLDRMEAMAKSLVLIPGPGITNSDSGIAGSQVSMRPLTTDTINVLRDSKWAMDRMSPQRRYLYPCTAMILVREQGDTYPRRVPNEIALFMTLEEYNKMLHPVTKQGLMTDEDCVKSAIYAFWGSFDFVKNVPNANDTVSDYSKNGVLDGTGLKRQILREAIAAMETVVSTPGADISKSGFDADLSLSDMMAILGAYKKGNLVSLPTYDPTAPIDCAEKPRIIWPSRSAPGVTTSAFGPAGVAPPPATKPHSKGANAETLFEKPSPAASKTRVSTTKPAAPDAQDNTVESDIIGRDSLSALDDIAWQVKQRNTGLRNKQRGQGLSRSAALLQASKNLKGLVLKRWDPRAPDAFVTSKSVPAVTLQRMFQHPDASRLDMGPATMSINEIWQYPGHVFLVVRQPSTQKNALKPSDIAFFIPTAAFDNYLGEGFGQKTTSEDVAASAAYVFGAPVGSDADLKALVAKHTTPSGVNYLDILIDTEAAAKAYLTKRSAELKEKTDAESKKEARVVNQQLKRIQSGVISKLIYDQIVTQPHSRSRGDEKKGGALSRLKRTLGITTPKVSGRGASSASPSTAPQRPSSSSTPRAQTSTSKKKGGFFSRLRGYATRLVGEAIDGTFPIGAPIEPHHRHLFSEEVDKLLALSVACGLEADAIIAEGP